METWDGSRPRYRALLTARRSAAASLHACTSLRAARLVSPPPCSVKHRHTRGHTIRDTSYTAVSFTTPRTRYFLR
ncbi:unnamed protein product, partial [Brenthis ino]